MAHVRRKFVDIHRSQGSPIAEEVIGRIAQLYAVEKEARGSPPDVRVELRKAHAAPVFDDLERWLFDTPSPRLAGPRSSPPRTAWWVEMPPRQSPPHRPCHSFAASRTASRRRPESAGPHDRDRRSPGPSDGHLRRLPSPRCRATARP